MRIGVDLGGTKIEALALDAGGAEVVRRRVPTPRDYDGSVEAVGALVEAVEQEAGEQGTVGVGIPGVVDRDGLVKNANSTWLNGRPFDRSLGERLGREVRVMNDANCFALSEATDGAAAGAEVVFGVILGTGVGGGVVVRGAPLVGPNLVAGEWGHTPLPWPRDDERPGPPCYCGLAGCVERWLSGPGLAADHLRATGQEAAPPAIVEAAAGGDAEAQATLDRYAERLGRGLAVVVNVLDPDVIVLGGGLSNLPDLAARVSERLLPWVFSTTVRTRVVRNAHGDSSGVRGAAWLWSERDAA